MFIAIIGLLAAILMLQVFLFFKNKKNAEPISKLIDAAFEKSERLNREQFSENRKELSEAQRNLREEVSQSMKTLSNTTLEQMKTVGQLQSQQLEIFSKRLQELTANNEQKLESLRKIIGDQLKLMQDDNSKKLEQMRATVEEKLQGTLDKRLGESFKLVSDRLELVHKGLGEMQNLAIGVGDLKKVLTNVKSRGTWGEVQLGQLLEQVLTPDQYAKNVCTKPMSNEVVEFAIKLPGRTDQKEDTVWLPVDAKFPFEDYQRLLDAQEKGEVVTAELAAKQLEDRIKASAKDIFEKYISPPHTTDFGILFVPTESLYAEILRRPGLFEFIQQKYRVNIAGPTTLAALMNSLQMGFRTLAIEKRSSEVWKLLGAIKTEFSKFGEILDKVQKKLLEATNTIDSAASKSRNIEQKLKRVEELPTDTAQKLLGPAEDQLF